MGKEKKKMTETAGAVRKIGRWVRNRSVREKVTMCALIALVSFILLKLFVKKYAHFYIAAQFAHASSIFILVYKLTFSKTCAGLSLKSQELTAIHLASGIVSSFGLLGSTQVYNVALDVVSLIATLWAIYMIRFKLKSTYTKDLDNMPLYYVLVPCAVAAFIARPFGRLSFVMSWLWSFSKTVEAISVLPQLRLLQNAKMVEPFTAHYLFALGIERFLSCAHWIIRIINSKGAHLYLIGKGNLWLLMLLICEVVQTFILSDFCYYYVKSVMEGRSIMRLPSFV
ncbi:hypothetical protein RND81_05G225300 [Saponaria officinalis]|uniref:ER lumen protein retaining receptor n=1 Tax=Saponaria officinalis TaxID=3572 RepID=A0AAW1L355_SAPOF